MPVESKLTEEEKKKALINAREFVNATKDCVDTGMYLFARVHPAGVAILGIAYAVKNLIAAYGPNENDPVVEKLRELRMKMDTMVDHMASHFTAFKAFFVENQFWNDVPLQTSVLFQYMQDVVADPTKESLREFQRQYEKTSPVDLARKITYQLQREVMNPLKNAMTADPLLTTKTFDMWHSILESVLMQLWEIEIKAGVWLNDENVKKPGEMQRVKQIEDEIDAFHKAIDKWDKEYEKTSPYWPDKVRQLVHDMQDNNSGKTNEELAQLIANDLEKIRTKKSFYVIVFPGSADYHYHENQPNQVFVSGNRNGFTVVVYRSLWAHRRPDNVPRAGHRVFNFRKLHCNDIDRYYWVQQKHVDKWAEQFPRSGLLLAVKADSGVGVKWTKGKLLKEGPGRYTYCTIKHDHWYGMRQKWSNNMFLLAGHR